MWRFEPGEPVLSTVTEKHGTMASSYDPVSAPSPPLVDFEEEGIQVVAVTSIIKDITLGQYVEVLAGVHCGRKGFVVAKTHALLGVSFDSNAMDIRLHSNSVRISTPEFLGTEIPWLNVQVKLLSGPFTGLSGIIKDVKVTSSRALAITVHLNNGHERTVGYHAVRELFSGQLLLDHQPLKRHQQQFDVEAPWKEIRVTILSGRFAGQFAIVKHSWIDFRGALRLSLWVLSYNCSVEVDYSAVHEEITGLPLHVYRPLEGNQLKEFAIKPAMEAMRTGPLPWLGLVVDIVKGYYKGQSGVVRDVNRYRVDPLIKSKKSGLTLTVERHVFTAVASTILVEVDYDAVRFHKTRHRLCEVFLPTAKQSFYCPEPGYLKDVDVDLNTDRDVVLVVHESSKTPLPNDFERETIFYGSWSPNLPPPLLASPLPPDHWILHPKLVGIPIKVDISSGPLDTSKKKDGIIVETVTGTDGIKVIYCRSATKTVDVPYKWIESFRDRPNPSREKGLMVVAQNHPEHIGKLVRRIHHFYNMGKSKDKHWLVVQRVDRSGPKEVALFEFLEFHPDDLEYVKETAEEQKWSTSMLESIRLEHLHIPAEVRPACQLAISM
ncbi:hypothetical protein D9757_012400 [Collybiopsis confluens]|uniref:KOW domain-containing protein n=1 Tax=Collybiopsis confluens TaxID=2823264 RepID=A0A8H5H0J3_9AGAR|nr:hypothetical protein D9757_012400 [Collybiopsis confluens]